MTSDFDYKKYSLENLDNWMHDAMSSGGATPQEIYDVIVGVVKENYYIYKQQASQAYELLALLNGTEHLTCGKDNPSPECQKSWNDFWVSEDQYYPHPDQPVYTEEELSAMCDKAASDDEKNQCREYNLREAEYYDKRAQIDADYEKSEHYWDTDRNKPIQKENKSKQWVLPVQVDGLTGDCFVEFPDDLLNSANLKEGDQVQWIDNGNGSYTLKKV